MTGLLRKEFYVSVKRNGMWVGAVLVTSCLSSFVGHISAASIVIIYTVLYNSVALDEKWRWNSLAAMLPYKTEQIVGCKYLIGFAYAAASSVINLFAAAVRDFAVWRSAAGMSLTVLIIMIIVIAMELPLLYRYGSEKGQIFMSLAVASSVWIIGSGRLSELVLPPVLTAAGIAIAAGGSCISFRLSVRYYDRRQRGDLD